MGAEDGRLLDRCEEKWAHPEYLEEQVYSLKDSATFMAEKHTKEEYEEYRKGFYQIQDAYEAIITPETAAKGSWKDYMTECGCPEEPEITVPMTVWTPNDIREDEKLPVMFYIAGGGLVGGGTRELSRFGLANMLNEFSLRVIYVAYEYRIAAEAKYPAAINDSHAAYQWMVEHAEELHIDTDKIALLGASSGGHLVLSLAFRLKRYGWCGAAMPRGLFPQVPVMDDVGCQNSNLFSFQTETGVDMIDSHVVRNIFKEWLGDQFGNPELPPEAVPNRATVDDIKGGFPPVWFPTCMEIDDGRDSVYRFASLLHEAGVFCDVHVWGGGTHQSSIARTSSVGKRMTEVYYGSVRDAILYDFRRPWLTDGSEEEQNDMNRTDPKWAHPESYEEGWYLGPDLVPDFYGQENIPFAELEKKREQYRHSMLEMTLEACEEAQAFEWKDYMTEHGCPEEPETKVHVLVATPKDIQAGEKLPVVFCFAGGGMINGGTAELNTMLGSKIISRCGERVIAVYFEYRIAPMNQYPAAINDGHAAYQWMIEHAEELQIDTDRIVFWGISSGGHTSLSIAFRLKRYNWCGGPMPRGIVSQEPVMDDVALNQSQKFSYRTKDGEILAWDGEMARYGFRLWLGEKYGASALSPEAVPNRATLEDMKGYPPVWFPSIPEFDGGRDSAYQFASLLYQAGIYCDFHEWGGTNHLFANGETTDFSRRFQMVASGALRDAIKYDFRRKWLTEE